MLYGSMISVLFLLFLILMERHIVIVWIFSQANFIKSLRTQKRYRQLLLLFIGDFVDVYSQALKDAENVLSIHLPVSYGSIHSVALLAAEQMNEKARIKVLDSNSAAMAQGFVVLEAARAAADGKGLNAAVARAIEVSKKVRLIAAIDTLDYLKRSGRINSLSNLIAGALNIKPVFMLKEGKIEVLSKQRTKNHAIAFLLKKLKKDVEDRPLHVGVFHSNAEKDAQEITSEILKDFNIVEIFINEFTPVMGAHCGPGTLGMAYYSD
mgnify:CR=1 FL=1